MTTSPRRTFSCQALLATALLASTAAAVQGTTEPASGYAGSEACATCHESRLAADNPHARPGFAKLSNLGCETCHGPAAAHVDDPENDALRPRITTHSAREQSAICQKCHDGGNQAFWVGGRHESRGLTCTTCHSIHSSKSDARLLKDSSAMEVCFNCHKNVRAEVWKSSHHPIREGKISCTDCHNPHGTETPKMIIAASVNDQCYTCHTEKRGPFVWEHPPVRENCMNCHVPHGSNHIKLQRTSVPYLCQQCHLNTRHPATLYDGFRVPTIENPALGNNRLFNRSCVDCHAAIHGSNHPSSPYLAH